MRPLDVSAGGMVTNLGLSRAATAAAYCAQLDNFTETRFMDNHGEWLVGAEIPLGPPLRGRAKLLELAARAISETLEELDADATRRCSDIPLLLCIPGKERPGRVITDEQGFFFELQDRLGVVFSEESRIIPQGKASVATAITLAETLLYDHACECVLVTAVDSLLTARTLKAYDDAFMLLTRTTSNGFVPGEGAACVKFARGSTSRGRKSGRVLGAGQARQPRRKSSEEPLRADGMIKAIQAGLASANMPISKIGFWFYDDDSAYQAVKEATIAELRLLRGENIELQRQSPISQFGETGVVSLLLMLLLFPVVSESGVCGLLTASSENDLRVAVAVQQLGLN